MLRKENELLIKKTRLKILITIHNTIINISKIPFSDKTIEQKFRLIELYKKQTKNNLSRFIDLWDFLDKVVMSITNFKNNIEKIEKELKQGGEKVINEFEVIASVSAQFPFALNPQTVSVKEFLSYEKLAKQQHKAKKEANGKG